MICFLSCITWHYSWFNNCNITAVCGTDKQGNNLSHNMFKKKKNFSSTNCFIRKRNVNQLIQTTWPQYGWINDVWPVEYKKMDQIMHMYQKQFNLSLIIRLKIPQILYQVRLPSFPQASQVLILTLHLWLKYIILLIRVLLCHRPWRQIWISCDN